MENTKYLLEMSNITKEFPGVKALDGANLKVRPHSVHALMGENGAGKSTLLKLIEKNIKEKHLECEVPEKEHYGKKFEDLTPEEMERIQGGGDVKVRFVYH